MVPTRVSLKNYNFSKSFIPVRGLARLKIRTVSYILTPAFTNKTEFVFFFSLFVEQDDKSKINTKRTNNGNHRISSPLRSTVDLRDTEYHFSSTQIKKATYK